MAKAPNSRAKQVPMIASVIQRPLLFFFAVVGGGVGWFGAGCAGSAGGVGWSDSGAGCRGGAAETMGDGADGSAAGELIFSMEDLSGGK